MKIGELINNSAKFLDPYEAFKKVLEIKRNGLPPGLSTGWRSFDSYFKFPPMGNLNVITGFPGSGKSEWLDSLAINMVKLHDWKVFYYSPENYPAEYHLQKLTEKYIGKPFSGNWIGWDNVTEAEIKEFRQVVHNNFSFIDCHINNATVDKVLNSIFLECKNRKVDMAIIDPWNKLESQKPSNMSNTDFIGECLTRIQMFSRQYGISFWIVAHPAKPMKNKSGEYTTITLYDICDSSKWYAMIDNGFIIHRSWEDKTGADNLIDVKVAKVKDRRYGKCGEFKMEFVPATGHYKEV